VGLAAAKEEIRTWYMPGCTKKGGAVDETCQPYQAKSKSCSKLNICRDCKHGGGCYPVKNPSKYRVSQYGFVKGEKNMMAEIKQRGPISCRQAVTKQFFNHKGGIFKDSTGDTFARHATSIVGWGKSNKGQKYWIVRNSWGTYWGENGYFKIAKGVNNLGIEEECSWGVPTISGTMVERIEDVMGFKDRLVTNEDLGASIDGTESLVEVKKSEPLVVASPVPVITSHDDHRFNFFSTKVETPKHATKAKVPMLADDDGAFKTQRQAEGVQQMDKK